MAQRATIENFSQIAQIVKELGLTSCDGWDAGRVSQHSHGDAGYVRARHRLRPPKGVEQPRQ